MRDEGILTKSGIGSRRRHGPSSLTVRVAARRACRRLIDGPLGQTAKHALYGIRHGDGYVVETFFPLVAGVHLHGVFVELKGDDRLLGANARPARAGDDERPDGLSGAKFSVVSGAAQFGNEGKTRVRGGKREPRRRPPSDSSSREIRLRRDCLFRRSPPADRWRAREIPGAAPRGARCRRATGRGLRPAAHDLSPQSGRARIRPSKKRLRGTDGERQSGCGPSGCYYETRDERRRRA